jgi:hypothetical protein
LKHWPIAYPIGEPAFEPTPMSDTGQIRRIIALYAMLLDDFRADE